MLTNQKKKKALDSHTCAAIPVLTNLTTRVSIIFLGPSTQLLCRQQPPPKILAERFQNKHHQGNIRRQSNLQSQEIYYYRNNKTKESESLTSIKIDVNTTRLPCLLGHEKVLLRVEYVDHL